MVKYCVDGNIINKDEKSLLDSNISLDLDQVDCVKPNPTINKDEKNLLDSNTSLDQVECVKPNPIRRKVPQPIVAVIGVCLLCLVLSTVTLLILHKNVEKSLKESGLICFTCHGSTDEHHYHGRFKVVRADGRCCLDKKQVSQELLGNMIKRENDRKRGEVIPVALGSHIGAHKHLQIDTPLHHTNLPVFGPSPHPLNISTTNNILEYASGIELTHKGIRVLYPGLYFVYMSIYFLPNTARYCQDFEKQTFFGWLHRTNGYRHLNDELLSSEHTCCVDCRINRETAFTGGVFYLFEGDMIHITVSSYGVIYISRDITFMGLSMMGAPKQQQETNSTTL